MNWETILTIFLLNGVVAVILRQSLQAVFKQEILWLEHEQSLELARLSFELQRLNAIEATRFTELQQRRAVTILDLYKLLSRAESELSSAASALPAPTIQSLEDERSWDQKLEDFIRPTNEAIRAISQFYDENKLLLSASQEEMVSEILDVFGSLNFGVYMRELYTRRPSEEDDEGEHESAVKIVTTWFTKSDQRFREVYPELKKDLEDDFRKTLGLHIGDV